MARAIRVSIPGHKREEFAQACRAEGSIFNVTPFRPPSSERYYLVIPMRGRNEEAERFVNSILARFGADLIPDTY